MKIKSAFVILIFLLTTSHAQDNAKLNYLETIIKDAEIFFVDGYSFYTYPLKMGTNDWLATAGAGVGMYLLIRSDDDIRSKIGLGINRYDNDFWRIFELYGVVQYAEFAGAGTYALGLLSGNENIRVLGRMIVQSLTYSGLTAMFLRMIAGRKRPPFTENHLDFIGFTTDNDYQSFPSGHTTVAFALSTICAEYIDTPLARIGFYSIAGLSAVERLINSQHWFTDVVLGSGLGILSALHVLNEEQSRYGKNKSRLTIQPTFSGITLKYRIN